MEQRSTAIEDVINPTWVVADWSVDPSTLRISNGTDTVKLEPKAMAVLEYLAARPGQVVSRQELEEAVWTGTVVGYDAISNAIIKLRKAFGDDAQHPQIIETIPKSGYRLIAPVESPAYEQPGSIDPELPSLSSRRIEPDVEQLTTAGDPRLAPRSKWKIAAAIALPAVMLIGIALVLVEPWQARVEAASIERMAFPLPDKPSIAVLPFINLSDDKNQEYFVDGMTEDLITDLSKLSGLFVVARNSVFTYKGRAVKVREVAEDLGVRYVLEGSVRRVGDNLRINAQLIDALSGGHVWAERYDGEIGDVFTFQDKVTNGIVEQLAVNLSIEDSVAGKRTEAAYSETYDLFLRGWSHYRAGGVRDYASAVSQLERALELDPDYHRARAALAAVYQTVYLKGLWQESLGLPYRQVYLRRLNALRLSKQNPTALTHQVEADWIVVFSGRARRALIAAEAALNLDPNDPAGHLAMASALLKDGRPAEARTYIDSAMRLDPLYPPEYLIRLGQILFAQGNFDGALESFERAAAVIPDDAWLQIYLAATLGQVGRIEDGKSALDRANLLRAGAGWGPITLAVARHAEHRLRSWFRWPGNMDTLREGLKAVGVPQGGEWFYRVSKSDVSEIARESIPEVEGVTTVDAREAKQLYDRGAVFVDTKAVWFTKRIPGSHLLEWGGEGWLFNEVALEKLVPKDGEVVIYAFDTPAKSVAYPAALAVSRGFTNVYMFPGGTDAWESAGYPLETGQ